MVRHHNTNNNSRLEKKWYYKTQLRAGAMEEGGSPSGRHNNRDGQSCCREMRV